MTQDNDRDKVLKIIAKIVYGLPTDSTEQFVKDIFDWHKAEQDKLIDRVLAQFSHLDKMGVPLNDGGESIWIRINDATEAIEMLRGNV